MIKKCWPGWYKVDIKVHLINDYYEKEKWCEKNLGSSDKDTWVFQETIAKNVGYFSFYDSKWAMMFLLRWS